jgi:tryptophanyl-tRNA synthetase
MIRRAVTDGDRHITYEPDTRPQVSNLVLLAALCQDRDPHDVAAEVGSGGAAALKKVVADSVNEFLRPIRARRAELIADRAYLRRVVAEGNDRANAIADRTLEEVRAAMDS